MRLLITGGHGFVGRYAVRAILARRPDAEVTLLARPPDRRDLFEPLLRDAVASDFGRRAEV